MKAKNRQMKAIERYQSRENFQAGVYATIAGKLV